MKTSSLGSRPRHSNVRQRRHGEHHGHSPLVEHVRENGNQRFADASVAVAEGYAPIPCASGQQGGAMGIHYVNAAFLEDGVIDIAKLVAHGSTHRGRQTGVGRRRVHRLQGTCCTGRPTLRTPTPHRTATVSILFDELQDRPGNRTPRGHFADNRRFLPGGGNLAIELHGEAAGDLPRQAAGSLRPLKTKCLVKPRAARSGPHHSRRPPPPLKQKTHSESPNMSQFDTTRPARPATASHPVPHGWMWKARFGAWRLRRQTSRALLAPVTPDPRTSGSIAAKHPRRCPACRAASNHRRAPCSGPQHCPGAVPP